MGGDEWQDVSFSGGLLRGPLRSNSVMNCVHRHSMWIYILMRSLLLFTKVIDAIISPNEVFGFSIASAI